MKTRLVLSIIATALAFVAADVWGQCSYTPQSSCDNPGLDLMTPNKWGDNVNFIRWHVSTRIDGEGQPGTRIIPDADFAARQWNNARCNGVATGFPVLVFGGETDDEAGFLGDGKNVIGFAYVDGPGKTIAMVDVFTTYADPNTIIECDTRLDYYEDHDNHSEFSVPRLPQHRGFCIQDTLTHEFGHWGQLNDLIWDPLANPGGLRVCPQYRVYTMNGTEAQDTHFRESLYEGDVYGMWKMYNGATPAPAFIRFPAAERHTVDGLQTRLLQNYPDPFNPETWIPYELADEADVTITIYDSKGRQVRHINVGSQPKGQYVEKAKAVYWDGKDANGASVASGVYFYTLKADSFSQTKRLVVLK